MNGIDIVVHCAAALPHAPRDEMLSTGAAGISVLFECAAAQPVEGFIFISSAALCGQEFCELLIGFIGWRTVRSMIRPLPETMRDGASSTTLSKGQRR